MKHSEAVELIRSGVEIGRADHSAGFSRRWADIGAGSGTFTRALRELLGADGEVWAIDRNGEALRALKRTSGGRHIHAVQADFTAALQLPVLDGILMANALHFVPEPLPVLQRLLMSLREGGAFLLVEYDRRRGNPWIPYPVPFDRFRELAARVGLTPPREVGRRPSAFRGELYAAVAMRAGLDAPGRLRSD